MSMKALDMIGQRFGRLLVLRRDANRGSNAGWLCQCDCGNIKVIRGCDLRHGQHTRSCGCWRRENIGNRRRTHGMSKTRIYKIWESMIQRCEYPRHVWWHRYGGRGISVCAEWRNSAKAFIDWALANGCQPGLEIDRTNNDGNYEPANCRFVSPSVNQRNKSPHACFHARLSHMHPTTTVWRGNLRDRNSKKSVI
jgi:hypothetical protein